VLLLLLVVRCISARSNISSVRRTHWSALYSALTMCSSPSSFSARSVASVVLPMMPGVGGADPNAALMARRQPAGLLK
jgi:hypothetical protein